MAADCIPHQVLGASSLGAPELNCMRQELTTLKTTLMSLRRVYPVSDALAPPETAALVGSARIPNFGRLCDVEVCGYPGREADRGARRAVSRA
jgi:hypothetical protein